MPQNEKFHCRFLIRSVAYALAGFFGLFCIVLGTSGLIFGQGAILAGFPASTAEALACSAGGLTVAYWAAFRIRHI